MELGKLEQSVLRELLRLSELEESHAPQPSFHSATVDLRSSLRRHESTLALMFSPQALHPLSLLRRHARLVEEASQIANECDRPSEREEMMELVRRHRREGETLLSALRELTVKVHTGRAQHEEAERQALLGESKVEGGERSDSSGLAARSSAKAAKDATESLR